MDAIKAVEELLDAIGNAEEVMGRDQVALLLYDTINLKDEKIAEIAQECVIKLNAVASQEAG